MSAVIITLGIGNDHTYPEIRIEDLRDARILVDILERNGVAVNARGTSK